jgi:putative ABC transport system permease protein
VEDAARSGEIAATIDRLFENSPAETKTQTEKMMAQGFANQIGDIGAIVTRVAAVVLFTILLIAASQMSLAVRERTNEIGALKAIGFTDGLVRTLVLAESLTLAVGAGIVGLGLAWLVSLAGDPTGGLLPVFALRPIDVAIGLGLAVALGTTAGLMPATYAMRLRISDALRRS